MVALQECDVLTKLGKILVFLPTTSNHDVGCVQFGYCITVPFHWQSWRSGGGSWFAGLQGSLPSFLRGGRSGRVKTSR